MMGKALSDKLSCPCDRSCLNCIDDFSINIQSTLVFDKYSQLSLSRLRLSRILPLISKRKSGPCFNTDILNQVTKYCGKEEKLLPFSTIFPIHTSN